MTTGARAVVFANSNVGVRCLAVLLARGVEVPLVVTHAAAPDEAAFANVEAFARERDLPIAMPDNPNDAAFVSAVEAIAPDFVFSFYYRQMLSTRLLAGGARGALNMHGSLLPRYRGRVPINWAVIRGETETGATLHYMTEKPDAGDIVDQQAVPILPDDTAFDVLTKVTTAAEIVLWRSLPGLLRGDAPRRAQDSAGGSYFGRRRPEDGRIDWNADSVAIHNLVRGVAPPYPGAFTVVSGHEIKILRTRVEPSRTHRGRGAMLYFDGGACFADAGAGGVLRIIEVELDGRRMPAAALQTVLGGTGAIGLGDQNKEALHT